MKTTSIKVTLLLTGLGLILLGSGCASIESKRSYNFMNDLPC